MSLVLALAACEQAQDVRVDPVAIDARYRLLFNGTLVGKALFTVRITPDGRYRIDAFTTPAGKLASDNPHEVLESSRGVIDGDTIRPVRFDKSVLKDGKLESARLVFDWKAQQLTVLGPSGKRSLTLLPQTQDRLSYLLVGVDLARRGGESALIQVASIEASEATRLMIDAPQTIKVPLGEFGATTIDRQTADTGQRRRLWVVPDLLPLPLRVLQEREGDRVEMQLEHLEPFPGPHDKVNSRSSDPR